MPELTYSDSELGLEPGWDHDPATQQPLSPGIREQLRRSRILVREAEQAKAEAATAKRQLEFAKAGVPLDAKGEFFAKAYDGEVEAGAVKAAYEALFGAVGDGAASTGAPAGSTTDDGTQTAARIAASANGSETPNDGGQVKFEDALKAARGDRNKVLELIREHGGPAGIKLPDIT